jgi:hypothetical protein
VLPAERTLTFMGTEEHLKLLRHADIPTVVEAMRQYWMPTRYARLG